MKRYMPLTSVASDWRESGPIVWKAELEGKSLETRGTVLRIQPERVLECSHSRPIFRASGAIPPENRSSKRPRGCGTARRSTSRRTQHGTLH